MTTRARGALLLLFDVAPGMVEEHDDWHTHEHMPERLAIPGFIRGTRWSRDRAQPRYCVVYDVTDLAVLDAPAYRARLDHPTPWTTKMMAHYRGMRRSLCEVTAEAGEGLGGACLVVTFAPDPARAASLRAWLMESMVPSLANRHGLSGCRLLEHALAGRMTREQAIRGQDDAVHSALLVTGYDVEALEALSVGDLRAERLREHGGTEIEQAIFGLAYTLTATREPGARDPFAAPAG